MSNRKQIPAWLWQGIVLVLLLVLGVNWFVALIVTALLGSLDASAKKRKHNEMAVQHYMNNKN